MFHDESGAAPTLIWGIESPDQCRRGPTFIAKNVKRIPGA
jgi:hypothetical protein